MSNFFYAYAPKKSSLMAYVFLFFISLARDKKTFGWDKWWYCDDIIIFDIFLLGKISKNNAILKYNSNRG